MTTLVRETLRQLTFWRTTVAALVVFAAYGAIVRFSEGLGAATHLSDAMPWGLWIGFDVLVGVGLAAGGFTIAATVHIFHIERYKPIVRPAIFTAFIGYLLVIIGLLFDLGQPWDIWHPLVMWNPRSVMFEVAWCVMLYTGVLALEFSPVVLKRFGLHLPRALTRAFLVPLVVIGVLLSMLHQSSLGTLYVIVPDKLYGLWYTPWLPVFFFLTAIAAGLAMTIVESYLSHRAFGRQLEHDLLEGLGRVIVVVLAVYLMWKVEDLAARGTLALVAQLTPEAVLFWGELGLGACLPLLLLSSARLRANSHVLFFGAMLTVLGFIVGRLNVAITGMARSSGAAYYPSAIELGITGGLVALGFTVFALATRYLEIFPASKDDPRAPREPPVTAKGWIIASLWGLLVLGGVLMFFAQRAAPLGQREPVEPAALDQPIAPARQAPELHLPPPFTFSRGAKSPGPVVFNHQGHVDDRACAPCHRDHFSLLEPGKLLSGELTMERLERGELCGSCHDGNNAFGLVEGECDGCHGEGD